MEFIMKKIIYCTKTDDGMIEDCVDNDLIIYDEIKEKVFLLNETSKVIWEFIKDNTKIDDIEKMIISKYSIPEQNYDDVKNDTQEILTEWEKNGLIRALFIDE